jgi:hypothetical protein
MMKWYGKWFWRRKRLLVWNNRLTLGLEQTSQRFPLDIPIHLRVSWGPFFSGCAWLNNRMDRATIRIQIPHDWHLTLEDRSKLREYQISLRHLPLFILNHEYYHLLDVRGFSRTRLKQTLKERRKQAAETVHYDHLPFEQQADLFASNNCREKITQAC